MTRSPAYQLSLLVLKLLCLVFLIVVPALLLFLGIILEGARMFLVVVVVLQDPPSRLVTYIFSILSVVFLGAFLGRPFIHFAKAAVFIGHAPTFKEFFVRWGVLWTDSVPTPRGRRPEPHPVTRYPRSRQVQDDSDRD